MNVDKLTRDRLIGLYSEFRPETDDELYEYTRFTWGITFPRKSHCPGCDAPFKVYSDCFFARYPLVILKGARGSGKFQSVNSLVLTPEGYRRMGDLRVGDTVVDMEGNPVKVTHLHPQGVQKLYRVFFNDGTSTLAGGPHLWTVRSGGKTRSKKDGSRKPRLWRVKTTEELMGDLYLGKKRKDLKWRIPIVEPIQFPTKDLPVDPYCLGLLLGDGTLSRNQISYTCHIKDVDLVEALAAGLAPLNVVPKMDSSENNMQYNLVIKDRALDTRNRLRTLLIKEGLHGRNSHTKFIPKDYLYGDHEQRLALLQGLLDTDGHAASMAGVDYVTASEALCEGVIFLVQSLGGTAVRSLKYVEGFKDPYHRLYIKMPVCPFRQKRKVEKWKQPSLYPVTRIITKIEEAGEEECQCITVDSPSSTYLTNDCIVTHNSVLLATLSLTEQVTLKTEVNILGASEEQALRINRYVSEVTPKTIGMFWDSPNAPVHLRNPSTEKQAKAILTNGGQLVCLTASPKNVRGRHPQRLRIDECDEADLELIDSALGCPQDDYKNNIMQNTLMASTHQHASGTLSTFIERANIANNEAGKIVIPVYKYCFMDVLKANGGFMDPMEMEKKRLTIPEYMFRTEYLNGDPSVENSIFNDKDLEYMFDPELGTFEGVMRDGYIEVENLDLEIIENEWTFYTGADWAKKQDSTVFTVMARNPDPLGPDILIGWQRLQKTNYPDQIDRFLRLKRNFPGPSAHDGNGPGEVIEDYLDEFSTPVNFSNLKLRNKIMNDLIMAVQQRRIKAPMIKWLYEQFKYATYEQFFGREHLPDGIASMAYALYARDNADFDIQIYTV